MNEEKQIEEMAKIICAPTANKGNCDKCGFKRHCSKFDDANDLYNAGYRKASDVAREVIDEFEMRLYSVSHRETSITGYAYSVVDIDEIAYEAEELKKKYTESEKDNGKV